MPKSAGLMKPLNIWDFQYESPNYIILKYYCWGVWAVHICSEFLETREQIDSKFVLIILKMWPLRNLKNIGRSCPYFFNEIKLNVAVFPFFFYALLYYFKKLLSNAMYKTCLFTSVSSIRAII